LGDWVKTSAGTKRNSSIPIGGIERLSISITLLASPVGTIGRISESVVSWEGSLSHWVKSLGDWVKTSAGSKWNSSITISGIERLSISITLLTSPVGTIGRISVSVVSWEGSLSHRVKSLGDWVKTSAGSKWNNSIPISGIESISISLSRDSSH